MGKCAHANIANVGGLLTDGLRRGGAGRGEALGEVDVAHVAAAAAEVVGAILDLRREVGHHAAVPAAALVVADVGPATLTKVGGANVITRRVSPPYTVWSSRLADRSGREHFHTQLSMYCGDL